MKDIIIIGLIVAGGYYLYNNGSTCTTEDDVMEKYFDLMREVKSSSVTNDPRRVTNLMQKFESLNRSSDYQATCDAIDEIMEEF